MSTPAVSAASAGTPVIVATKSAWLSKTNWAAAATGLGVIITQFLPFIPAAYQGKATAAVALLGAIGVWITKTFYTTSISPSSLPDYVPTSTVSSAMGTVQANALNLAELQRVTAAQK